ncbi:MAG: CRTAC1 family protein [Gemmatimonadetes bacterium]|nr:CRTAC1 family protein [Gemmatimonadota bacterium]
MRAIPIALLLAGAAGSQLPAFRAVQPEVFSAGSTFTNAVADFDGDGDLDLFVGFSGAPDRLYRNDAGRFTDIGESAGVASVRPTRAAAWGDYDGDGDPDLLLGYTPAGGPVLALMRNDDGRFTDVTAVAGLTVDSAAVRQPVWIDFDADGDVDLFVALRDRPNMLFRNDAGRFTNIAEAAGLADPRRTVGAVWFDFDEDGDLDLLTGNMDGDANGLFRNDRGRFTDVAASAGLEWSGRAPREPANGTVRPCAEDVNGDGRIDVFTANYGPNGLLLNRGRGVFEDVSRAWGIAIDARYDTCAFADFDHDGRLDLYVNGTVTGGVSYPDHLFRNHGAGFEDVTPPGIRSLEADHGVLWADLDRDGDLDLALTGAQPAGMHSVLENLLAPEVAGRSLLVMVLDARGRATRAGAEVRLFAAGTDRVLATRLVDSGSGYNSQSIAPVHFGLATLEPVDVEVAFATPQGRQRVRVRAVAPAEWKGRIMTIRTDRP